MFQCLRGGVDMGLLRNKMPVNILKLIFESLKEKHLQKGSRVFSDLLVVVSTFNYDSSLRNDRPFYFIESIQENKSKNSEEDEYKEALEENFNWNTKVC